MSHLHFRLGPRCTYRAKPGRRPGLQSGRAAAKRSAAEHAGGRAGERVRSAAAAAARIGGRPQHVTGSASNRRGGVSVPATPANCAIAASATVRAREAGAIVSRFRSAEGSARLLSCRRRPPAALTARQQQHVLSSEAHASA